MKKGTFNGYPVYLVQTLEDIETLKSRLFKKINVGLDTETTGLTFFKDHTVGYCLSTGKNYSVNEYAGYYLPVKHTVGKNLPLDAVLELIQYILDNHKTVFWNRNFDAFMMEGDSINIPFVGRMHDAQMMMHLVNGDHMPALKASAKNYLKWNMIDFESNKAENHNFATTDPEVSFVYGGGDAISTVMMAKKLWMEYPYIRKIYPLDNKAVEAVRRLSKAPIYLNEAIVARELETASDKLTNLQQKIFAIAGYPFKINSNKDKADALSRFITLTVKTAKGNYKVDSETLSRIDHPLAQMLVEYAQTNKYISSYLKKMDNFPNPFRCSYSTCNVPTGRLSSGGQANNTYFANFNIQNVPKIEVYKFIHNDPELGHIATEEEEGSLGKIKCKAGLRSAFVPPEGYLWMSCDYSGQEMCLMANFSKEPNLVQPLLEGKDIHNHVAESMFGFKDPSHRTKVKILNFAVNYGGNEYTVANKLQCAVDYAKGLLYQYKKTLSKLELWKESLRKEARRKGMVFTYFGRPRVLYKYYNSSDSGIRAFADRSAVNSPVQGCIPLHSYVETAHSVVPMSKTLGTRLSTADGRTLIPTHRGHAEVLFCRFKTGDFIICDFNHKFISGSLDNPFVEKLRDGLHKKVLLSPLHRKTRPSLKSLFKSSSKSIQYIRTTMKFDKEVPDNNRNIAAAFWKLAITRKKFPLNDIEMSRIRSLGSIYGFNVKANKLGDLFYVSFSRATQTIIDYIQALSEEGVTEEVGSCTCLQGYQLYPTQGFQNKNTGGDLIRLSICKVFDLVDSDPEFAENCIPSLTVHDEIDFYIKPSYLYKGANKVKELMEFFPDNFVVPLKVSIAVGKDWGCAPDVVDITPDNKIVLI